MCFNPHARVGRDNATHFVQDLINVSIHTPAWGATQKHW